MPLSLIPRFESIGICKYALCGLVLVSVFLMEIMTCRYTYYNSISLDTIGLFVRVRHEFLSGMQKHTLLHAGGNTNAACKPDTYTTPQ